MVQECKKVLYMTGMRRYIATKRTAGVWGSVWCVREVGRNRSRHLILPTGWLAGWRKN